MASQSAVLIATNTILVVIASGAVALRIFVKRTQADRSLRADDHLIFGAPVPTSQL